MISKVQTGETPNINSFASFPNEKRVRRGYLSRRYHNLEESDTFTKVRATAGAVIGTAIPLVYFAKKQNGKIGNLNSLLRLKYGLKEFITIGAGSIFGGTIAGMLGESKRVRKNKLNEGVFQFMNCSVPPVIIAGLFKLGEKVKPLNNVPCKIGATIAGVGGGMYLAAELSNKINDPKDLYPDRKLTIKDALANFDDVLGALVLAKFKFIEKLGAERLLPAVTAWCGYRAGVSN